MRVPSDARARSKECVDADPLFDFLRGSIADAPAPPKRARRGGAPRSNASAGAAASGDGGGDDAATGAIAGDYRPLAGADDDYDAED